MGKQNPTGLKDVFVRLRWRFARLPFIKPTIFRFEQIRATAQAKRDSNSSSEIQTVHVSNDSSPKYKLGILTRIYNERNGIQEFVAFHIAVGVEHFYLYDNSSTDDTVEQIQPFIDAGYVTLVPWPDKPISPRAETHCLNTFGHECEWIACIDADEFLYSPTGKPLPEVLEDYTDFPGVVASWMYFGSSGHEKRPTGLIMEAFTKCEGKPDAHFKSIVQPKRVAKMGNTHFWYYHGWQQAVDENKRNVFGGNSVHPSFNILRINHYFCKSREDYMIKVDPNYYSYKPHERLPNRSMDRIESQMQLHNDIEDHTIQPNIEKTKDILRKYAPSRFIDITLVLPLIFITIKRNLNIVIQCNNQIIDMMNFFVTNQVFIR